MSEILAIRKTHRYVGTYRDMDEWEDIGEVTDMGQRLLSVDDDDPCEYTVRERKMHIRCDEPQPDERIERAIRDTYSSHGCAHEYDCCGCWSYHVTKVDKIDEGGFDHVYRVEISASRNY